MDRRSFIAGGLLAMANARLKTAAPARELPSPAAGVAAMHADLARTPVKDRYFYRYLWVTTPPKERDDFLLVLKVHLNLLSREGALAQPVLIAPNVIRFDTRELGWEKNGILPVWEALRRKDYVFHVRVKVLKGLEVVQYWPGGKDATGKEYARGKYDVAIKEGKIFHSFVEVPWLWKVKEQADEARKWTLSESPIVMAEWFFVQTARQISLRNEEEGTGYYDFLGLKTRDDFFKLTKTDKDESRDAYRLWRGVVKKSGISQHNRQILVLTGRTGRTWGTLDTFKQQGRGIAEDNLREGEFEHNAEEWYGYLPNGLWVTFLADNKGVAQASAPDKIGPDDSSLNKSRDSRVHANLSCIRCHGPDKEMLKPIDEWVRKRFRQGGFFRLQDPNKRVEQELRAEYLRDINRLLSKDRQSYSEALSEVTISKANPKGITSGQFARLYAQAWDRYTNDVTPEVAASEIGTTADRLKAVIKGQARAIRDGREPGRGGALNSLVDIIDGEPIARLTWEDRYALGASLAMGVQPPEILETNKPQEKKK